MHLYASVVRRAGRYGQRLPRQVAADARDADRLSVCAGYRIETGAATGWTDAEDFPLADASAPSATYAPADGGMKRFSWIWEAVGWQVVVDGTNGSPGAVTVSGADLDGYFSPGATAPVTAVPGPGATFGRWHGDVPAGHETDATLTPSPQAMAQA